MSDLYLFRSAIKDLLRIKRLVAALVLIAIPTTIALIWRFAAPRRFEPEVVYNTLAAGVILGFVLVIMAVVFGTGILSQEIEQKTIIYLLTRPVPRWRILLMKFIAAVLAITVTAWLASVALALVTFGPSGLGSARLGRDLLILPVGALAYGAVFLLLATLLNRPLMYGLLFAFGWESWVPNMPGNFQKVSLMSYLRVLAPHPQPESEAVEVTRVLTTLNPQTITQTLSWQVLLLTILIALTAALLLFSLNEYVPREDAE